MSQAWLLVGVVGLATIGLKAAGPLLLGGRRLPGPVLGVVTLLAPALLAALVATSTFASGQHLVLDARALGVGVAAIAAWRGVPVIGVVLLAAAVTALARTAGLP